MPLSSIFFRYLLILFLLFLFGFFFVLFITVGQCRWYLLGLGGLLLLSLLLFLASIDPVPLKSSLLIHQLGLAPWIAAFVGLRKSLLDVMEDRSDLLLVHLLQSGPG